MNFKKCSWTTILISKGRNSNGIMLQFPQVILIQRFRCTVDFCIAHWKQFKITEIICKILNKCNMSIIKFSIFKKSNLRLLMTGVSVRMNFFTDKGFLGWGPSPDTGRADGMKISPFCKLVAPFAVKKEFVNWNKKKTFQTFYHQRKIYIFISWLWWFTLYQIFKYW